MVKPVSQNPVDSPVGILQVSEKELRLIGQNEGETFRHTGGITVIICRADCTYTSVKRDF